MDVADVVHPVLDTVMAAVMAAALAADVFPMAADVEVTVDIKRRMKYLQKMLNQKQMILIKKS